MFSIQALKKGFLSWADFDYLSVVAKEESLELFGMKATLGDKRHKQAYRDKLGTEIDHIAGVYREQNSKNELIQNLQLKAYKTEQQEEYVKRVSKMIDDTGVTRDHVKAEHIRRLDEATRDYKEKAKDVLSDDELEKELKNLVTDMEDSFALLQKRYEQREYDRKMQLMQSANECILLYEEEMKKFCATYVESAALNEFHDSLEQRVVEKFNNGRSNLVTESEESALEEIRQIISDMKTRFERENRGMRQVISGRRYLTY